MDKQTPNEQDKSWMDDILSNPEPEDELGADESAVNAAGLIRPEDAELERIIQEVKLDDYEETFPQQTQEPEQAPVEDREEPDLSETAVLPEETEMSEQVPLPEDTEPTQQIPELLYAHVLPEDWQTEAEDGNDDDYEDDDEEALPPAPKGRPARKRGYGLLGLPHIAATLIWLLITVSIGVSLGRMLWICASDMLAFGRTAGEVTVTMTINDDLDTRASKLKNAGLIRYPELFKLFVQIKGDEEELIAGTFTMNTLYDYNALVNAMKPHSPARQEVEIMIPEGYNCAQIFALLEEKQVCTVAELEEYAANGELDEYWFLEGVERGHKYSLEGYLFPNTYRFYLDDEPRRVLQKFLNSFDDNFTDIMKERILEVQERFTQMLKKQGYGEDYIAENQLTLHKIVTLASIVEKESANVTESYTVASVFYNRLANQKNYPYLQSDATVYYAIGGASNEELTAEDLAVDSPYNTYKVKGLPPGPIANPGQSNLNAALDPDDTDYYFFFYDSSAGVHRFAKNLKEHNANIDKYGD